MMLDGKESDPVMFAHVSGSHDIVVSVRRGCKAEQNESVSVTW